MIRQCRNLPTLAVVSGMLLLLQQRTSTMAPTVQAFSYRVPQSSSQISHGKTKFGLLSTSSSSTRTTPPSSTSALFMSDIPQDDTSYEKKRNNNKNNNQEDNSGDNDYVDALWEDFFKFSLPPPPEDQFVMVGDLLSLSVYAFSDHFFCQDLASYFINTNVFGMDTANRAAQIGSTNPNGLVLSHPVWLDVSTQGSDMYRDHVMHVILADQTVTQYSPILQPTGLAAFVLASAWLLCGWWHRAFLYQNTLDCSANKALQVTAKTWFTMTLILMVGVAASNMMISELFPSLSMDSASASAAAMTASAAVNAHKEWWQTFTKGDLDYIWDSLTVLGMWRFLASWLMGGGADDE